MKRYDVCSPRERKDGKTYWQRVGSAFEGDKGIGIEFDALPLPDKDGRVSVRLFEPKERQASSDTRHAGGSQGAPMQRESADLDDDVPFISCDPALEWRVG